MPSFSRSPRSDRPSTENAPSRRFWPAVRGAAAIELRDLSWAIAVSRHRSLRQAAETLNVRQSTLSRRLNLLEYQLGATLVERTNGGTRPTGEGQEFLKAAQRIIDETADIALRLKARSRGDCGTLSIGIHASISAGNLRATLIEFRQRFPNIELHLVDGASDHLISELCNAVIDIAFLIEANLRWDGRSLAVWSERAVAAIPENHCLSGVEHIDWGDLAEVHLLVPQRGPGPELMKLLVEKAGVSELARLHRHDVSLDRLLTLVGAGCGVLLALEGATGPNYPGVIFREIRDRQGVTRVAFRALWRNENNNPSLRPFLEMLRERYPDLSVDGPMG